MADRLLMQPIGGQADKKEGVLKTPSPSRSPTQGRKEMIQQPFKRRCAVCNRLNVLCEPEDCRRTASGGC